MADTIRGDGLFRVHAALAALAEDPERLERARDRFSKSPSRYRTWPSGTATRSQSPNEPSEEEQRREQRKWKVIEEQRASTPHEQFDAQTYEEGRRILLAAVDKMGLRSVVPDHVWMPDSKTTQLAMETVKKRWVEQGIWNDKWKDRYSMGPWKHEEPLELESDLEPGLEAEGIFPLFSSHQRAEAKPGRPKSDQDLRLIDEQRAIRKREREMSRPFYQFIYQLSKERDRIQD